MKYLVCPSCDKKGQYQKGLRRVCRYCDYTEGVEMELEWRHQPSDDLHASYGEYLFVVTPEGILFASDMDAADYGSVAVAKDAAARIAFGFDEESLNERGFRTVSVEELLNVSDEEIAILQTKLDEELLNVSDEEIAILQTKLDEEE